MTFKRHKLEWFTNRVGQQIRWTVPKGGKLSAVQTKPLIMMIMSAGHAKALHDFHLNNKINFYEATPETITP